MLPVSDAFLAALRGSHEAVFSVVLCDPPGQIGVTPTGRELAVVEGSVTLDGDADIRGTLDVTLAEDWPAVLDSTDLTPYGAELFVTRGVRLGNGAIQRAPLGYFRVETVEQSEAPRGALDVTARDRMAGIVESRLLTPYAYTAAAFYGNVVAELVADVYPGATVEWDDTTYDDTLGRAVVYEDDRYAALLDVVTSAGKVMWWDYRGHLIIRDVPDASVPVWTVDAGRNGVLVGVSRSLGRDGVFNAVKAEGEAIDDTPPVAGYAYDLDPTSPTYWDGPFGRVPRFYSSPLLTTSAKATTAAASLLAQSTGLPYVVDFSAVPNPALEPFDPVEIVYPVDRTKSPHVTRETHVLSRVSIPLSSGGTLGAATRKVTL